MLSGFGRFNERGRGEMLSTFGQFNERPIQSVRCPPSPPIQSFNPWAESAELLLQLVGGGGGGRHLVPKGGPCPPPPWGRT